MTPIIHRPPTWLRVLPLLILPLWWYMLLSEGIFNSTLGTLLTLPLAVWFCYIGVAQIVFLIRGNPPVLEVHDDVVIVRSAFRSKVFSRSALQVKQSNYLFWNSLVLRDGKNKAPIVNNAEMPQGTFDALNAELLGSM